MKRIGFLSTITLAILTAGSVPTMCVAANEGNSAVYKYTGTQAINTTVSNMLFDNTVLQETGFSIATNDTVTLAEAGHYLVLYNMSAETTGGSNRSDAQFNIELNGTNIPYGWSSGYIRRSGGTDQFFTAGGAIIETSATNQAVQIEGQRTDSNTATIARRANESGLSFLRLRDNWVYARMQEAGGGQTFDTASFETVLWDTNDELDTGITRSGGDITLARAGHYLITYNMGVNNSSTTIRRNVETRLTLDGTEIEGTRVTAYVRGLNDTVDAVSAWSGIVKITGTNTVLRLEGRQEGETVTSGITNIGGRTAISIVKLPDSADYIRLGEITGGQDVDTSAVVTWDEDLEVDTNSFDHDATNTERINIETSDHYLFFATLYSNSRDNTNIDRMYPRWRWRVSGTDELYGSFGSFNRGDGTTSTFTSGNAAGVILPNLLDTEYVDIFANDESSGTDATHVFEKDMIAIQGVNIPSIFATAPVTRQAHFRWRADDFDLNVNSGYLAAEDDNAIGYAEKLETYRLRLKLVNTSLTSTAQDMAKSYELQFGQKESTCDIVTSWVGIENSADDFAMQDTSHINPDGENITGSHLSADGYTFTTGSGADITDTVSHAPLDADEYTEFEYSITPTSSVKNGQTYCFRLFDVTSGATLDVYAQYPEISIVPTQRFSVYRDTGTDTISTTLANAVFDTTVKEGTESTMETNRTDITLTSTGHYLVLYNISGESTGGTNRSEVNANLELSGIDSAYGRGGGYIRRAESVDEFFFAGAAVLETASANETLQLEIQRTDNNTATVSRRANESGLSVLKLDDNWHYARIREIGGNQAISTTTFETLLWDQNDELDSNYSRSNGEITIKEPGHYLVTYNAFFRNSSASIRTNVETRLMLDGTEIDSSRVTAFMRGANSCQDQPASWAGIIETTSANQVLRLEAAQEGDLVGANITNVGNQNGITITKLPEVAHFIRIGEQADGQAVDVNAVLTFDEDLEEDTQSFDHDDTNTERIHILRNGDYLFFGSFYSNSRNILDTNRMLPHLTWRKNSSDIPYGSFGRYNRGNEVSGGNKFTSGNAGAIIVNDVKSTDYIDLFASNEASGTDAAHTYEPDRIGIQGVNIDSLFPVRNNTQFQFIGW